jgi:imidazole glycerol phosphate synthase glutamine amidotransferase subunit
VTDVVVFPTGTANLASVLAAFRRVGVEPSVADESTDLFEAPRVVVPGVGAFGAAVAEVDRRVARDALVRRVEEGRPTLAVCVGMQLLAAASEESPGVDGLGVLAGTVSRFDAGVRVPHMGWSRVRAPGTGGLLTDGWAYFANSFRLTEAPEGWSASSTVHGSPFVSALEREAVLACQFHPELSGSWGLGLLRHWVEATGRAR